jgi:hypothetical protein
MIIDAVLGDCAPTGAALKAKNVIRSRGKQNRFAVVTVIALWFVNTSYHRFKPTPIVLD